MPSLGLVLVSWLWGSRMGYRWTFAISEGYTGVAAGREVFGTMAGA